MPRILPSRESLVGLQSPSVSSTARVVFPCAAPSAGAAWTFVALGRFPSGTATVSTMLTRGPVVASAGVGLTLRMSNSVAGRLALTRGTNTSGAFNVASLDNAIVANAWRWYAAVINGGNAWLAASSLGSGAAGRLDVRSASLTAVGTGLTTEDVAPFSTHVNYNEGVVVASSGLAELALVIALPWACSPDTLGAVMRDPRAFIGRAELWATFGAGAFVPNQARSAATGHGAVNGSLTRVPVAGAIPAWRSTTTPVPSTIAASIRAGDALRAQASVSGSTLRVRMG